MSATICLIRHGETDWNSARRIQGQIDVPLNETGIRQAEAMAIHAARHRFSALYSSDLARASDTAGRLAARLGLEVRVAPQLRERHFGILQGLTSAEAASRHPRAEACHAGRDPDCDFECGESLKAFAARVEAALGDLAESHPGQTLAVVSHAGVLDVAYRKATGRTLRAKRDFPIPNCALNWFRIDGADWHLESWADCLPQVMVLSSIQ